MHFFYDSSVGFGGLGVGGVGDWAGDGRWSMGDVYLGGVHLSSSKRPMTACVSHASTP